MAKIEWVSVLAILASCAAPKGDPSVELRLSPSHVSDASPVQVKVIGIKADGTIATGNVRITSARGSLVSPMDVQFDEYGTAETKLVCDPVAEPGCAQPVRVVAEWTSDGTHVSAEARLNATTSAGGGGGSGAGGGSGVGGSLGTEGYVYGNVMSGSASYAGFTPINNPMTVVGLLPRQFYRAILTRSGQIFYVSSFSVPATLRRVVADPPDSSDPLANDVVVPDPCQGGIEFLRVWPDTDTLAVGCSDLSIQDPALKVDSDQQIVTLGWDRYVLAFRISDFTYSIWKNGSKVADLVVQKSTAPSTADRTGFIMAERQPCGVSRFTYATGDKASMGLFTGEVSGYNCCDFGFGTLSRDGSEFHVTRFSPQTRAVVRCDLQTGPRVVLDSTQVSPVIDVGSWAYVARP